MIQVEDIVRDDALCLRYSPGKHGTLVVVFNGAYLRPDGLLRNEFLAMANHNGRNPVLNVQDMQCTWYSAPGMAERITDAIAVIAREIEAEDIVMIGNSMGGYGAMVFAQFLPVSRVLATAPQISMDPDLIDERRFDVYRPNFGQLPARSANDAVANAADTQFTVIFGHGGPADNAQAALLDDHPNLTLNQDSKAGHNVAKALRLAGKLKPIVHAVIYNHTRKLAAALSAIGPTSPTEGEATA